MTRAALIFLMLASVAHGGTINLTWRDNSPNENGFEIQRRLGSEPDTLFRKIAEVGANETTYTDNDAEVGKTYTYRVRAFNQNGQSQWSNKASGQPKPPNRPTGLILK